MKVVTPEVTLIGCTTVANLDTWGELSGLTGWAAPLARDATDAEAIIEFAGRGCYESWEKPNANTRANADYIRHILEVGHFSVIEHGTLVFYIRGVSRSLTHELVRHRHFSYSQLSQRYVDPGEGATDTGYVVPPGFADDPNIAYAFAEAAAEAEQSYEVLMNVLQTRRPGLTRKEYRQAARAVLPNMTETRLVLSGNFRAFRHFFGMRCTEAADVEIRGLAIELLRQAQGAAANVFGDFVISSLPDGTEVAETPNKET